jgi:hypothetical protein
VHGNQDAKVWCRPSKIQKHHQKQIFVLTCCRLVGRLNFSEMGLDSIKIQEPKLNQRVSDKYLQITTYT